MEYSQSNHVLRLAGNQLVFTGQLFSNLNGKVVRQHHKSSVIYLEKFQNKYKSNITESACQWGSLF